MRPTCLFCWKCSAAQTVNEWRLTLQFMILHFHQIRTTSLLIQKTYIVMSLESFSPYTPVLRNCKTSIKSFPTYYHDTIQTVISNSYLFSHDHFFSSVTALCSNLLTSSSISSWPASMPWNNTRESFEYIIQHTSRTSHLRHFRICFSSSSWRHQSSSVFIDLSSLVQLFFRKKIFSKSLSSTFLLSHLLPSSQVTASNCFGLYQQHFLDIFETHQSEVDEFILNFYRVPARSYILQIFDRIANVTRLCSSIPCQFLKTTDFSRLWSLYRLRSASLTS